MTASSNRYVIVSPATGSAIGAGNWDSPIDSLANGHAVGLAVDKKAIFLVDSFVTLPDLDWRDWEIAGNGNFQGTGPQFDFAARSQLGGMTIRDCTPFGDAGGGRISFHNCHSILVSNTGPVGQWVNCLMIGDHDASGGMDMEKCTAKENPAFPFKISAAAWPTNAQTLNMTDFSGPVFLEDYDDADWVVNIAGSSARIQLDATVVFGTFTFVGTGAIENSSAPASPGDVTINKSGFLERHAEIQINSRFSGPSTFVANVWLESYGQFVTGVTNATISIHDENGNETAADAAATPDANGVFKMTVTGVPVTDTADQMFYWKVSITEAGITSTRTGITGLTGRAEA